MNRSFLDDTALLLLRLGGLGLALAHGYGKVAALATGQGDPFIAGVESLGFPQPALFASAAAIGEFGGGLLVALGLGTRLAAAFAGFTMLVAGFVRHHALERLLVATGAMSVPDDTLRSWGNPELALLYLLVFGALVLTGGGRFSLDRLLARRPPER